MTDITELAQSLKRRAASANEFGESLYIKADDVLALLEALEKAQGMETYWKTQCRGITDHCEELQARIAELESHTVKPPVHPTVASENLDDETLQELIEFRRTTFEYHSKEGNKVQTIIHGVTLAALRELQEHRKADSEPVAEVVSIYGDHEAFGEREIRPLIGIQQMPYGTKLYRHAQPAPVVPEEKPIPNTLSMYAVDAVAAIAEVKGWNACRAAMLQGLKKSAGTEATCRSNENAQVLNTIKAPPALGSLQKTVVVQNTNSPVNDVTTGKPLTNGDSVTCKSLTSINPAPALVSLPKNAKSLTGNSPVNDVTAGKPLTIFLPDISSKAFWSGAGKNETFHPETYRRWAKEAIERGCIIACIDVEVK